MKAIARVMIYLMFTAMGTAVADTLELADGTLLEATL